MKKHIANIITVCRIVGSALLLLFPTFSKAFYVTYILCGFSDMIDGTVARRTNSESKRGSQLDTVADFAFVASSMFKVLPEINVPLGLWIWCGAIALVKIGNIILGYVIRKRLVALHTIPNKITGTLLFLTPLIMPFVDVEYTAIVVCISATISAIHEAACVFKNSYNE